MTEEAQEIRYPVTVESLNLPEPLVPIVEEIAAKDETPDIDTQDEYTEVMSVLQQLEEHIGNSKNELVINATLRDSKPQIALPYSPLRAIQNGIEYEYMPAVTHATLGGTVTRLLRKNIRTGEELLIKQYTICAAGNDNIVQLAWDGKDIYILFSNGDLGKLTKNDRDNPVVGFIDSFPFRATDFVIKDGTLHALVNCKGIQFTIPLNQFNTNYRRGSCKI